MKLCEIPMVVVFLVSLCLLSNPDVPSARADFVFGKPVNLTSVIPAIDPAYDDPDCLSYDGLEMYIESFRSNGYGEVDLWVLRRNSLDADWGPPENLGAVVNSSGIDNNASISADGLTLYFGSNRPGGQTIHDLYMTTRATRNASWGPPVNLGPKINSSGVDASPWISADGLELYFQSRRPGGYGSTDLYVTTRPSANEDWGEPTNLGPAINTPDAEAAACTSPDGLVLFFNSTRPGGYGKQDLYMARRATRKDSWGVPVNLGPVLNSLPIQQVPRISPDGHNLYFWNAEPWNNWQAPIIPILDFNGDGKVDAKDMGIFSDNWGKNTTLCDIGPFAWGDGVVDERDLRVLMESLMTPGPKASDVPCDVVLKWVSPSIAKGSDIYLGTSFEAVNMATRDDPRDVLVSWGQKETTCVPEAPLEFSRTYYWRVDTVLGPANTSICKGPVLSFTVEPFARPIQNIVATASSSQANMGPAKTVDGSGLDQNDGHSTSGSDMWLSMGTPPNWIQYQFDKVYTLHELWVWNSNQMVEPFMGFGARTVKIEYSTDGAKWTPLANVPEFAKASGKPGYVHNTTVSFGGISAKYVKLTIEKNWGGVAPPTGLSEVRFFYIPDRPAAKP